MRDGERLCERVSPKGVVFSVKMRRYLAAATLLCLLLTACGAAELDRETLGWEEDWTAVGDAVASEPVDGFEPRENLDAMSASGLWYATWTAGEMEVRENEEGQRSEIYDAQIYLLVQEAKSEAKALAEVEVWKGRERDSYGCGESSTGDYAGMSFEVIPMLTASETNPYSHGAAAFGVRGKYAVSAELLCREGYEGDAEEILTDFLAGLHFNDKEAE